MSQPKDPWDDTGFEPGETDDSFQATPKPAPKRLEVDATKPEPLPVAPLSGATSAGPSMRSVPPPKERKRGALYWVAGIAGVLLVCAIGGFAVWFMFGERSAEDELIYSDEPVPAEVPAPVQDTAVATLDTMALGTDSMLAAIEETPVEEIAPEPTKPSTVAPTPKPAASAPAETKVNTKPKSITTPSQPPVVKQDLRPEKVAPPPTTSKPSSQIGSVSPNIKTQQPPKSIALPLYVVQVFSSPSRDDADEWLQSLREKKVPGGYIVEQPIKGRPWYRVRFGEYTTRQDAEAAALRYGITQPWIARVR